MVVPQHDSSAHGMPRISERGAKIAASRLGIAVADYREHEARDEHWCSRCEDWSPRQAFSPDRRAPRGCQSHCILHRRRMHRERPSARSRGISYAGPAYSTPVAAPHAMCPSSIRHLCEGRLPAGWIRSSEVRS